MGMFDFFTKRSEQGYGDSNYSNDSLLGNFEALSYKECMNIYRYWPLGKRVARALPEFVLSVPRIITFDDLPIDCRLEFEKLENELQITKLVKNITTYTRVFGVAAVFVAHKDVPADKPLTYEQCQKGDWTFNLQDPLTLNGLSINQDPLSVDFQKVTSIRVNGSEVDTTRCCVCFNDVSFYLQWVPSAYSFGATSIYQNMTTLIESWNRCIIALERMATKSSAIVYKNRDAGIVSGAAVQASKKTLELIRNMQNDGAVSIMREDTLEGFPLTGIDVVDRVIEQINKALLMALADTPATILLDKELAQGFGNGGEDMKVILNAAESFRSSQLAGIYEFIDKYLLYKMCSPTFLEDLRQKYQKDLGQLSVEQLREKIIGSFHYEWGNLYPETETERVQSVATKLDNLSKLKELGANIADIQTILNNDNKMYDTEITLDVADEPTDGEF